MSKIRVYELAKQLNITSKVLVAQLKDLGIKVVNHMSTLESEQASVVTELLSSEKDKVINNEKDEKLQPKELGDNKENKTENNSVEVTIPSAITVGEFSKIISQAPSNIIKKLMSLGVMVTINQDIDFEVASIVAEEYGYTLLKEKEKTIEEQLIKQEIDQPEDLTKRPPVITVMGHVDHGKTSLLDAIRKTKITAKEAGGITQHIGAYTVKVNSEEITFLDTPGHEAFTSMRLRGASITDIAILVVAADDGVMPQTIEAINHAKAADVPIIVAINKIDKADSNPDRVKQELTEYGLIPEDWGGDTICVPVSAITSEGIENLLEMILLVAEMQELKANPNKKARGSIIEAELHKGRGTVATLLVETGTIHVGDSIVAGAAYGKVRAMVDDKGKVAKKAGPSAPVEILGLSEVPTAGDLFYVVGDDKLARNVADKNKQALREKNLHQTHKLSLDDLFSKIQDGEVKEINIIIKADVQGSIEVLKQSLERLSDEEVRIKTIHKGVGGITESDVMLASASNGIIIGFNVRPDNNAQLIAEKEKVDMRLYRVIYNAIEDMQDAMKGMLEPEYKEVVMGKAEVRQTIKVPNVGMIAGSYVTDGKINRNNQVRIIRDGIVIHEGTISSLKRFKDDAREVLSGYECGIGIEKYNDLKDGDIIEAFTMEEIPR